MSVAGRCLLLVVGDSSRTHLAPQAPGEGPARAALGPEGLVGPAAVAPAPTPRFRAELSARRWAPRTLCGRPWHEMAAGESGPLYDGQPVHLAPECASCLRVLDAWLGTPPAPPGVELLAALVVERIVEAGAARVRDVPAEHAEALRTAVRARLRARGWRVRTHFGGGILLVTAAPGDRSGVDAATAERWERRARQVLDDVAASILSPDPLPPGHRHPDLAWGTWVAAW